MKPLVDYANCHLILTMHLNYIQVGQTEVILDPKGANGSYFYWICNIWNSTLQYE